MHVAATMACHGSVRAGRRLKPRGDERAAARDGSDAQFRPMQSRPPDLCGIEARRHRTPVRAALSGVRRGDVSGGARRRTRYTRHWKACRGRAGKTTETAMSRTASGLILAVDAFDGRGAVALRSAGMADPHHHPGGAVHAGRRRRYFGTAAGPGDRRNPGAERHRREHRRRRRDDRGRPRRPCRSRRLHLHDRQFRHPCLQPVALQEAALQFGDRLHAGRAGVGIPAHPQRPQGPAGQRPARSSSPG